MEEEFSDTEMLNKRIHRLNRAWLADHLGDMPRHIGRGRHVPLTEDNFPHYCGKVTRNEGGGGSINVSDAFRSMQSKPLSREGMDEMLSAANGKRKHRKHKLTKEQQHIVVADAVEVER